MASSHGRVVDAALSDINDGLATLDLPQAPESLYEPVRYILSSGGKRIRPLLVLLTAEAFGGETARAGALPAALAVEVFHNFTLVHDDIMDHAATRRGRETVHTRWSEPVAILSGDVMMGVSYDLLSRAATRDLGALLQPYHTMVRRLCEGQALDLAFETQDAVSVEEYLAMIDGKTGALLELALDVGALLGGGDRGRPRLAAHGRPRPRPSVSDPGRPPGSRRQLAGLGKDDRR